MPHDRSLLTLLDLSRPEIERLWLAAAGWKDQRSRRRARFADRRVATVFDGPALRSRLAYDTAIDAVGAHRVDLPVPLDDREPVEDVAAILSGAVDAVVVRAANHEGLAAFAEACDVPVINAMSDAGHPVEVFSEAFSVLERRGPIDDVVLTFVGEATNVLRSWCELTVGFELEVRQVCPPGHGLDEDFLDSLSARRQRGSVTVTHDLAAALDGADVIYTDAWPKAARKPGRRRTTFEPYQITQEVLDAAGEGVLLMHAMPVRRGDEVTAEAFADPRSVTLAAKRNLAPTHAAIVERALNG
ncbi:ornithine carbamoyltransferase [Georgenia sp. AZ-5]|uniref:ornithine carbamoyltransferase n=1 Tax=Georgenia sp. AZ-5 TaxID=3367526 RepID=UPI003754405E